MAPVTVCSLDYRTRTGLEEESSLLQPGLQPRHIAQDDTPAGELHQFCSLEIIEDLGDRLPQRSDHIAQLLSRYPHHLAPLPLPHPYDDGGNQPRHAAI